MPLTLIALYCYVCDCHNSDLRWQVQRFSPNSLQGEITDEELLTIYLFCVGFQEKTKLKSMHSYIAQHWLSYFPKLPAYQTFVSRINRMADLFPALVAKLLDHMGVSAADPAWLLVDSMPIVTCSHKRRAKVALDLVDKGYCATKETHYYGLKLHLLAQRRDGAMPMPACVGVTPASVHDLTALRPVLERIENKTVVGDKAYADQRLDAYLRQQRRSELVTPVKGKRETPRLIRYFDQARNDLFSSAVAALRQPVESFFSWLQGRTQIHLASKVRSSAGLRVHVFGKLAAALCILMNFNP